MVRTQANALVASAEVRNLKVTYNTAQNACKTSKPEAMRPRKSTYDAVEVATRELSKAQKVHELVQLGQEALAHRRHSATADTTRAT